MKIEIEWHPCNEENIPDSGRLVLFQHFDSNSGELLEWDNDASWANWNPKNDRRWCYVDELAN